MKGGEKMYGIQVININELNKIPLCDFWNKFEQIKIAMKLIIGGNQGGELKFIRICFI